VAAAVPPHEDGYETEDLNKSLVMDAAIDKLTIAFTNFLCIAKQCQHRHGQNGETGVQAINIVHDLQFE